MTVESFKQVYFSLHSKLYRVAYTILKNTEDAEDIIQDAYCKLWNDCEKLVDIQKPEAYCVTLVKHLCLDFLRSSKTMQNAHNINDFDFADHSATPDNCMENRETIKRIKSVIRSLPETGKTTKNIKFTRICRLFTGRNRNHNRRKRRKCKSFTFTCT